MEKLIIFNISFLLSCISGMSQITMVGCTNEWLGTSYIVNQTGTTNDGGTIRNTFQTTPIDGTQGCPGFGFGYCEMRIMWSTGNSRWEVDLDDGGGGFYNIYYNSSASYPNPPDLSLGTWVENTAITGSACGSGITTLSGDVQNTITLPVSWADFQAQTIDQRVVLNWGTYVEINSKGFEVQRSRDGHVYTSLGMVPAAGNSLALTEYQFTDWLPNPGENVYRLKQIDQDGTIAYSKRVSLIYEMVRPVITHTSNNQILIDFPFSSGTHVTIMDSKGSILIHTTIATAKEQVKFIIPTISSGLYVVKVQDRRGTHLSKWIR